MNVDYGRHGDWRPALWRAGAKERRDADARARPPKASWLEFLGTSARRDSSSADPSLNRPWAGASCGGAA